MAVTLQCTLYTTPQIVAMLEGLTRASLVEIRSGLVTQPLYSGRVRYQREPAAKEIWLTIADVMRRGRGDCEDLCAARCAELRAQGENALPLVKDVRVGLRHCLVRRENGQIEDPSRILGMGSEVGRY